MQNEMKFIIYAAVANETFFVEDDDDLSGSAVASYFLTLMHFFVFLFLVGYLLFCFVCD